MSSISIRYFSQSLAGAVNFHRDQKSRTLAAFLSHTHPVSHPLLCSPATYGDIYKLFMSINAHFLPLAYFSLLQTWFIQWSSERCRYLNIMSNWITSLQRNYEYMRKSTKILPSTDSKVEENFFETFMSNMTFFKYILYIVRFNLARQDFSKECWFIQHFF